MGAPTVYYYDDPGAPVISSAQDGFYQILRACLVDGYGSKPAAGWSVVYDDWAASGNFSIENAAQTGVFGMARAASGKPPFVFIADAMIDAASPVNGVSGRDAITTTTAFVEGDSVYTRRASGGGYTPTHWCVVANDNFAVLFTHHNLAGLFTSSLLSGGNDDKWRSCVAFGVANSLRGYGSVSAPEAGNFLMLGGRSTRSLYSSSYVSQSGWADSADCGCVSQEYVGGSSDVVVLPFYGKPSSIPTGVDAVVELPLSPLSVFATPAASALVSGEQIFTVPCLASSFLLGGYVGRSFDLVYPLAEPLRGRTTVAGREQLWGPVPGCGVLFVSLAADDWP